MITIDSSPASIYNFAYRPLVYTVSSNDVTVIRCLADIYIDDVYTTTLEKSPDFGETDVFTFDVKGVLQDNLKAYAPSFTASANELLADTDSAKRYRIRFYEVLDNGTTFDTSWAEDGAGTSYTQQSESFAYNGTFRHEETADLSIFKTGGTYAGQHRLNKLTTTFASQSTNKARKIKSGDFAILSTWHGTASAIQGRMIEYDSTPSSLSNTTTATLASTNRLWHYAYDTANCNASTKYLLQRIESTSPSAITDYAHWEVVDDCNDYVSLYWQNDFGGIDYYLFRDGQIKNISGESNSYTKPLSSSFNSYDFGETVLNKKAETVVSCVSEPLNRTEADALSNCITHAVRAWILSSGTFIPVLVSDGSTRALDSFDGEYRLNIDLLYSNGQPTQRY